MGLDGRLVAKYAGSSKLLKRMSLIISGMSFGDMLNHADRRERAAGRPLLGHGVPDALVFGDIFLTSSWVRRALETMHENGKYRKLFCLIETCFAGSVAEECSGIPGVLLYTATNPNETSKAENFDSELNVYLSDRFSAAFRAAVAEREDWTPACAVVTSDMETSPVQLPYMRLGCPASSYTSKVMV